MAIVDPALVMTMPKKLTAYSGIDALVHAIEAIASVAATDYTNALALEAARILCKYLPSAYTNGEHDAKAREKVRNAATLAGKLAFGKTKENLDIYHALENLSECGKVLYKAGSSELVAWQEKTKRLLLEEGYEGVHAFLGEQKQMHRKEGEAETAEWKALERVDGYLTWHKERLNYRERLSEGRAIGSGQIEGACKSMIGARLKQTGARWKRSRVNKMGVVCSLFYADQWDEYWKYAK